MTKIYKNRVHVAKTSLTAVVLFLTILCSKPAGAQTFYSNFNNPKANTEYVITGPSGGSCSAPVVADSAAFADADLNNYSSFSAMLSDTLTCTNKNYVFNTALNMPPDTTMVAPGTQAGFRIRIPGGISGADLNKYITINTYMGSMLQESASTSQLLELDFSPSGGSADWFVYFITSMPFNRLELVVNGNIITPGVAFEFDVYYALAARTLTFPVIINNFKAALSNGNAAISWQSLNEVNVSSYSIERSSNGGTTYSQVGSLTAKGNGNYTYTDKLLTNGNYVYRLKVTDKDGSFTYSGSAGITAALENKLLLYPTLVSAGQAIHVISAATGSVSITVYDAQGRVASQEHKTSSGEFTISTNSLSAGVYVVKIINATGAVTQSRFVVR